MLPLPKRRDLAWALPLLVLSTCTAWAQGVSKNTSVSCSPPDGAALLRSRVGVRYVLLGELHGTTETPPIFGELVCDAAAHAKRVLVGLEFSEDTAGAFQDYIASKGTAKDKQVLLANSHWLEMAHEFPDGRTSVAMWKMVERLRELRATGMNISVTTLQRATAANAASQTPYEIGMANSLSEAFSTGKYDVAMVLVGSVHARRETVPASPTTRFEPMAMHLPGDATLTLEAVAGDGDAWNCTQAGCGVHGRTGRVLTNRSGIVLDNTLSRGYDGIIQVGRTTAAVPVLDGPK
jgi:hypothetical protein